MSQESDATPLEQKQAEAIARWLDGGPRPSDIDAEVAQAIYALRPDLAPPLTMTANDLMAGIGLGTEAEVQSAEPTPLVQPDVSDLPAPANNRQWFFTGLVGLAVAAAGLIVFVNLDSPSSEDMADMALEAPIAKLSEPEPQAESNGLLDDTQDMEGQGAPAIGAASPITAPDEAEDDAESGIVGLRAPSTPELKKMKAAPRRAAPPEDVSISKVAPGRAVGSIDSLVVGADMELEAEEALGYDDALEAEDEMPAFDEAVSAASAPAPARSASAKSVADATPGQSTRPAAPDAKTRQAMLASAPSTPMCSAARGVADLVVAGEHQKAIHRAKRSLMTRDWKPPECLSAIAHWHGRALLESGQPEEALRYFERAIELKSEK